MAKTETDVAQNLKSTYMAHVVTIRNEYQLQISKWKPYFTAGGAQKVAVGSTPSPFRYGRCE